MCKTTERMTGENVSRSRLDKRLLNSCLVYRRCMMESGQCDCRRHLIGRQCSEVQPGFFCAPLDYYKYEAEDATGHSMDHSALPVSTQIRRKF